MMDYPSLFLENDSIQNIFVAKMSHKQDIDLTNSKHECDLCDYKTPKKELMRQHTLIKHSGIKTKCPNCAFTHYYAGKVRSHFQEVHLKEKKRTDGPRDCFEKDCKNTQKEDCIEVGHNKVVCKQCDYHAFTKGTMRQHIRNKHEGRFFSCNQCDFKSERQDEVNIHTARIHDGVVYRCDRCDLVLATKNGLRSHNLSRHSDKTFQCDRCDYKCVNKFSFNSHKRTPHDGLVYRCDRCDLVLVTKSGFKRHNCFNNSSLNQHKRTQHKTKKNIDCFQIEADEHDSIDEEDDLVNDKKVKKKEEQCEILMKNPLQQYEAEKPVPPIESIGMMIKCNDCSYSSQNEDISKLHLLSHKYSETEIMKSFPPTLKNLTFSSEQEFSKNLDVLLKSLSATGKEIDLK